MLQTLCMTAPSATILGFASKVQEEMARRANLHSGAKRKKRVYSSKYALSSIVYCPQCGEPQDSMEQSGQTLYGLAVLYPCGAWTRGLRRTDHTGIRPTGGGCESY